MCMHLVLCCTKSSGIFCFVCIEFESWTPYKIECRHLYQYVTSCVQRKTLGVAEKIDMLILSLFPINLQPSRKNPYQDELEDMSLVELLKEVFRNLA